MDSCLLFNSTELVSFEINYLVPLLNLGNSLSGKRKPSVLCGLTTKHGVSLL